MKTIKLLVPIDFSQSSKAGVNYAILLANSLNAEIIFIHTYAEGSQYAGYGAIVYPVPDNFASYDKFYNEKMGEFLENFPQLSTISYKRIIISGPTVKTIVQIAKEEEADLIIMGTEGANAVEGYFIGTVSEKISTEAHCSIMIVPEDIENIEINSFCLALDYDNLKVKIESGIFPVLLKTFNTRLIIVHFSKEPVHAFDEKEIQRFYAKDFNMENISFHVIYNEDPGNSIDNFLMENKVDVLTLVYREHNFLEKLTEIGFRKKMIFKSRVPLLVLK